MKSKFLLLLILFCGTSPAQQKWERWGSKPDPYLHNSQSEIREYNFSGESVPDFLINSSVSLYWLFISDQDGDRCPFYPSCSSFFLHSVKKTNLLQGILMFSDRFTRDMNIFERRSKYPFVKNNRLYDPAGLYTLNNVRYPPGE